MTPVELPVGDLRQPDGRSCGAACAVVDAMLADPAFAAEVGATPGGFAETVRTTHRRLTAARGADGRFQLPWPRAIGTPPWALAHGLTGPPRRVRTVRLDRAGRGSDQVAVAVADGHRVPVYVGDRWLPRHVVLAVGAELRVYDPALGRLRVLPTGRWGTTWFVLLPPGY